MPEMKAIGLHRYLPIEHEDSLVERMIEKPVATGRDLLVKIEAVAVNPVDIRVRTPRDKTEENLKVLGWDAAGIVVEVGEDCRLFRPGDQVYYAGSIKRPGTNSEYHLVDERIVGRKPASLDYAEAASLPLTGITAWEALFERLGISQDREQNRGRTILMIGAAGGVGSIALQLARHVGLTVIGTASRSESTDWVLECGAHHVIDHRVAMLPQLNALGLADVDYILCLSNTDQHWAQMASAIAPQGKICSIVPTTGPVDLSILQSKSVTFAWESMFARSSFQTKDMEEQHRMLNRMAELIDEGVLKAAVTQRFSPINAANLKRAHAMLESNRTLGKIVLEGWYE